jgi:hypothetical protein
MSGEFSVQIGPTNSEVGAAWTAYILGELYTDWPRRRDFDDLLVWLRDNGFVAFNQATEGEAFNVALTERGFAVLGKRAIEHEPSLGSRMKEAAKSAGKDASRAVLASLVGAMVSGTLTALKG